MDKVQQKVENYIDAHKNEAITFLQKLVQQPSLQGNEKGVQAIVIEKLNQLNLKVIAGIRSIKCYRPILIL